MIDSIVGWILDNLTGVASLILTAVLVALYYQQKEILRVEKLPEVEIASRIINGDQLEVMVSNYGHGLAKDIRFCTNIHAPDAEEFEPMLVKSRLSE